MKFLYAAVCVLVFSAGILLANHPVLVEGNCNNPPPNADSVPQPGTCGDYDGDGRIGAAEDGDGDRVFGTIRAALANATGANQNGSVTIVTSGTFAEVVQITGANGNVTLQAAPGVDADIDAVLQGDPGNNARQGAPGIIVNSPGNRRVFIRNLTIRNWTSGIRVLGDSHVSIENCRFDGNTNFGIEVAGNAKVVVDGGSVLGTGFRVSGVGDFPGNSAPNPGAGVLFAEKSTGAVFRTLVSGNFAAGIVNMTHDPIRLRNVYLFDNNKDLIGRFANNPGQF